MQAGTTFGRDYIWTYDTLTGRLELADGRPTRIVQGVLGAITALEDALQAAQDMSLDPAFCHQLAAAREAVCAIRALMESGPRAGQVHEGSEP